MASYRSLFERSVASKLTEAGALFVYEPGAVEYTVPAHTRKYTPDFVIHTRTGHMIYVETKGHWKPADRLRLKHIRKSNPWLDLRMVFQRARNPIRKGSRTTYADWCDKQEVQWAEGGVPEAWLNE